VIYTDVKILIVTYFLLLQVFAVLFFVLLFILGVGTSVALLMTVITVIRDNFPSSKYLVVAVVTCVLGFFATLVYVTRVSK